MTEPENSIVEQVIEQAQLNKIQAVVLRQAWQGLSYAEIAKISGYDPGYIKDVGSKLWQLLSDLYGVKVTKLNCHAVLRRVLRQAQSDQNRTPRLGNRRLDWGEAIDVTVFYGRTQELATLRQWIVHDRCRLVALLGMGGMGKTSLSVKLAEQIQGEFEHVIWRSLRDAPPPTELLHTLIRVLTPEEGLKPDVLPETLGGKLSILIEQLRATRTLVILDNFDAVLQSGERAGIYRSGYEAYGELLKRLGEIPHQGCIVLTSREKPQEVAVQEGEGFAVRTLGLAGVDAAAGYQIVQAKGLTAAVPDLERLVEHYRGNPLALKIAATSICDLFGGDVMEFLQQGSSVFSGIATLLLRQFERLSDLEQQVMYWLAIDREPVDCDQLLTDILPPIPRLKLLDLLESLRWRGLIERSTTGFTQQPVVMEAVTERLIDQISQEMIEERPRLLSSHALIKAQVKDYIRDSQGRVIIQPLLDRLSLQLGSVKQLEHKLERLRLKLREFPLGICGYGSGNLLNLYRQLETDLSGSDFSGLHIRQAYLQDVNLHRVNFTGSEFTHCAFASTFGGVTCVAFSPDGQQIATSDTTGGVQVWRLSDGQQQAICQGHNSWVWHVAFSPIHPILASCGQDHQIRLWDLATGTCLQVLTEHTGIVSAIAFSPDGQWLASASGDQTVRLWDVATGKCLQVWSDHQSCVWAVAFHPDGQRLLSAGEDQAIRVWDCATGSGLQVFTGHQHWIRAIAISPDGRLIASASFDQTVKLWDLETGACLDTLIGHHKTVTAVSFSADGRYLASSSYDQTVKLWDLATGSCRKTLHKHTNLIWSVAFHPIEPLLASGGEDYTARIWEVETGHCRRTFQGYSNAIYTIALHQSQRLLVSGHEDQTLKLWDLQESFQETGQETGQETSQNTQPNNTGSQPFRVLRGHQGRVFSIGFNPAGSLLASGSSDRTIKLWNAHTGQCLQTLQGHASWVWAIAFDPQGQQLASASYDQTVRLWEVASGECQQVLRHPSAVLSVAFSPDGTWLASGGYDQTIKLWHVGTGDCMQTWQAHLNRVWVVCFSPEGRWLATGGDDGLIHLWDLATGKCEQTLTGHSSQVLSIGFSPDGRRLYSGSADQTIRVWDLESGKSLILAGHRSWVWSLQEARLLLSAGQDETIKYWSTATGECLQTLQSPRPYEGMIFTGATGLTAAQRATLQALGAIDRTSS